MTYTAGELLRQFTTQVLSEFLDPLQLVRKILGKLPFRDKSYIGRHSRRQLGQLIGFKLQLCGIGTWLCD